VIFDNETVRFRVEHQQMICRERDFFNGAIEAESTAVMLALSA
jgi:hypothetical protein